MWKGLTFSFCNSSFSAGNKIGDILITFKWSSLFLTLISNTLCIGSNSVNSGNKPQLVEQKLSKIHRTQRCAWPDHLWYIGLQWGKPLIAQIIPQRVSHLTVFVHSLCTSASVSRCFSLQFQFSRDHDHGPLMCYVFDRFCFLGGQIR